MDKAAFLYHNSPIRDAKLLPVQPALQPVGRRDELAQAHLALKSGKSILLHGKAGVGKSTLAAVLAAANIATNPGGALWFTLTEDDLEQLLARVARAYGLIALPDNPEKRRDAVRALLDKRKPLIIFDGLTDISAIREFAGRIAGDTPLVVTAEGPSDGPWLTVPLGPLPMSAGSALLRTLSGVKDPAASETLDMLGQRLESDPFALTLAGRFLANTRRTPGDLLRLVPSSDEGDPQTEMIKLSFRALPVEAQGILLIMAALFSESAGAELIGEISGTGVARNAPILQTLEAYGLTMVSTEYGSPRYHIHESVQSFLRALLESNHRRAPLEDRAIQAILRYAERHASEMPADHDKLATEMDNFVGAAAAATDRNQEAVVSKLIRILSTQTGDFIVLRGFQTELGQLMKLERLMVQPAATPDWIFAEAPQITPPEAHDVPGSVSDDDYERLSALFDQQGSHDYSPTSLEPALVVASEPETLPASVVPPLDALSQNAITAPPHAETVPTSMVADAESPILEQTFPKARPPVSLPPEAPRPLFTTNRAPEPPRPTLPIPPVEQPPQDDAAIKALSIDALQKWLPKLTDKRLLGRYNAALAEKLANSGPKASAPYYTGAADAFNASGDAAAGAALLQTLGAAYVTAAMPAEAASTYRQALNLAYGTDDVGLQRSLCYALGQQLVDDQRTLRQAESLLAEASPSATVGPDADRLLRRARQRIDRLKASGVVIPAATDNKVYASQYAGT